MRKLLIASLIVIAGIASYGWRSNYGPRTAIEGDNVPSKSRDAKDAEKPTPPVISSATASLGSERSTGDWSTTESRIIKGNAVDAAEQQRLLLAGEKQFSNVIDSLEAAMLSDPAARELGSDYRELLTDLMRDSDGRSGLSLDRFACSARLCIAQMSGNETAWDEFNSSLSNAGVTEFPAHTRSTYAHQNATTGTTDYRLFFTTDPQITGFRVRIPKSTRAETASRTLL